jgi:tetratricopeptide (TPR) repeat protein
MQGGDTNDEADSLDELLRHNTLDGVDSTQARTMLAKLVDTAGERANMAGLDLALKWSDELCQRELSGPDHLIILYFRANAWGRIERVRNKSNDDQKWRWKQPELQEEMLLLRRVIASPSFSNLHRRYQVQVLTNLGNVFSTIGRVTEAIELRDRVLAISPRFGMALGTRAESLLAYGRVLRKTKDGLPFLRAAIRGFEDATSEQAFYESSSYDPVKRKWRATCDDLVEWANRHVPAADAPHCGASVQALTPYREWCVEQRLCLSPLNDLGAVYESAYDRLHLPALAPHNARSEMLMGYLDTMQQELVSARWSYYETKSLSRSHDSDASLRVHDTGDGPVFGLRNERMKMAFRAAYSVLDKIAYFLNAYFNLGISASAVSFRSLWFERDRISIRSTLAGSKNWPLRGLYWLARDFIEPDFIDVTEPDAVALADIRNHIEHKYLRVVREDPDLHETTGIDSLVYVVGQISFEARTLRLLKLVRAALLYLVLAVHDEEMKKPPIPPGSRKTGLPRL